METALSPGLLLQTAIQSRDGGAGNVGFKWWKYVSSMFYEKSKIWIFIVEICKGLTEPMTKY